MHISVSFDNRHHLRRNRMDMYLLQQISYDKKSATKMSKEVFFILLYGTSVYVTASRPCEDVTIIGAGIGGTYAGWRLRNEGLRIGIYEFSNRVGGRMYTRTFREAPDLRIDLGAMIVVPQWHPRMNKSAHELGLKLIPVYLERDYETLLFLRGTHLRPFEIDGPKLPYRLSEEERPSVLIRKLSEKYTDYNGTDNINILAERYTAVTIQDGEPVYRQSYLEVVQKIGLSKEAYNFIVDSAPFRFGYQHESATEKFLIGRNSTTTSTQTARDDPIANKNPEPYVFTVDKGMDAYPKSLLRHFLLASPNRHTLHKNRQLVGISKIPDGYGRNRFELQFKVTSTHKGVTKPTLTQETVCSKKIILAIPKQPLQQITFPVQNFPQFQQYVDSVIDVPVSKIFLLYDNPWWRQIPLNFTHTRSDLPYHQSYDLGVSKNGKGALLASTTDDKVPYWRHLQNKGTIISVHDDETRVTSEVVKHVHLQLSKVYNISFNSIPDAVDGIMFLVDSYPFNGGWAYPKPGFNGIDVKRFLTKPFKDLDIFIVHGYYGLLYNFWAESSLEAADEVLLNFGIKPLSPIIGL